MSADNPPPSPTTIWEMLPKTAPRMHELHGLSYKPGLLFNVVKNSVHSRPDSYSWDDAIELLCPAMGKVFPKDAAKADRLKLLLTAARCAEAGSGIDGLRPITTTVFNSQKLGEDWGMVAYALLGGKVEMIGAPSRVPVAVFDDTKDEGGQLLWLNQTLYRGAITTVSSHHPEQIFDVMLDTTTTDPMATAWRAAKLSRQTSVNGSNAAEKTPGEVFGVYSLDPWENEKIDIAQLLTQDAAPNTAAETGKPDSTSVSGPSFTAAAARGWSLHLEGKRVDPRLLVIGAIKDESGELESVSAEGVIAKTKKVVEIVKKAVAADREPEIDRIAVVKTDDADCNYKAAHEVIKNSGVSEWLDVVDIGGA